VITPDVNAVLSNALRVRWDTSLQSLIIEHADKAEGELPQIQIRSDTLDQMNFVKATSFIGERIALLIPSLRDRYVDPKTGMVDMST
jgi:hypothetical protein